MLAERGVLLLQAAGDASVCCALLLLAVYLSRRVCPRVAGKTAVTPRERLSADQLADRRMAAAKSEAERGFAACMTCGFENFARLMSCALCGITSANANAAKHEALQAPEAVHTRVQPVVLLRALKRKEWTRDVDTHGRLVWRRHAVADSDELSPGYVLRFELSQTEPEAERGVCERTRKARSLSAGYDPRAGVPFELIDSFEADALRFPLPPALADAADTREELTRISEALSTQDFPTKYAGFIASATGLLQAQKQHKDEEDENALYGHLVVHRDFLVEQSVDHINCISEKLLRSIQLRIHFSGEEGGEKDVGGLHREWLTLLNERLVDPGAGLFVCSQRSAQTYFINPQSARVLGSDHLQYFHAVGRLVGRALLEGAMLNFHLCAPLLKMMLGTPLSFGDLEELDPEMYRNLVWLLDHDGAQELELNFTATQDVYGGRPEVVELIPAGRNIQVDDDNKFEFADRKFRFTLFESVAPQLAAFLKGFYAVVPQRLLLPFDYDELDYLLCGSDQIDVSDWQSHTRLALTPRQEIAWFWDVVREMSSDYQRRLLQFATGCSRVPLVGFQGLTSYDGQLCEFTLADVCADAGSTNYFRSHACHNMLELPRFVAKDELRRALFATLDNEDVVGAKASSY